MLCNKQKTTAYHKSTSPGYSINRSWYHQHRGSWSGQVMIQFASSTNGHSLYRLLDFRSVLFAHSYAVQFPPLPGGLSFLKDQKWNKKSLENLISARPTHHTPPSRPTSGNTAPRKLPANFPPPPWIVRSVFQKFDLIIKVRLPPGSYQLTSLRFSAISVHFAIASVPAPTA